MLRVLREGLHLLPSSAFLPATWATSWLVWLLARRHAMRAVSLIAGGLGILVGWVLLVGVAVPPGNLAQRLPATLFLVFAFTWLAAVPRLARATRPGLVAVGLLVGWWFAGAPVTLAGLAHYAPLIAVSAGWLALLAVLLAEADGWSLAAASIALAAALHAVGAPPIWPLLAVVPAASCAIGQHAPRAAAAPARRRGRGTAPEPPPVRRATHLSTALPIAIAASAAVAAADQGRVHPSAIDAACLAPAAAIWLMASLRPRLRWLGPAGSGGAALLTIAGVALVAFSAAALARLR